MQATQNASLIAGIIYLLTFVASVIVIFVERRSPSATLAWLFVMWMIPGVGLFIYLILSQPFVRHQMNNLSSRELEKGGNALKKQMHSMLTGSFSYVNNQAASWRDLIHLNQRYSGAYLTQDNKINLFTNGQSNYKSMFADISAATKSVNVLYFIIKPDEMGLALLDLLARKAAQGVKVRLLMDAMGCNRIKRRHYKPILDAGGEVELFLPGHYSSIGLNFNYRNHRKLVIIDNKIAYLGGLNAAREYVGLTKRFKDWRDTNIRLEGESVYDVDRRFMMDWNYATGQNVKIKPSDYDKTDKGDAAVQIVSCGPESPESEIKLCYLKMINGARRRIYIQTPYFVPDDSIIEAVKTAALAGVDVRIMLPSQPDHPFVYWVSVQNAGALLDYGVKVYLYNKGFLHSKTVVVDSEVSSVGSANFDIRSFDLNFECNAVVYDREFALEMEKAFENDITNSTKLTKEIFDGRSNWIKIKESIGRLLSGIL